MPFFERDGLALHYADVGEGPPVLLVHGWGGRGRRQWHATMQQLKDRYRFIALDLRGHGRSKEVRTPRYGWSDLVDDAEALREVLGIEAWTVVGYSFGGLVALEYARRKPAAVVAACAVAPMVLPPAVARIMRWLKIPMATLLRGARHLPPSLSTKALHNISKSRLRTLFHTVRMMEDWKSGPERVSETVPVIVIIGELDRLARSERVLKIAQRVEVRVIEDAGHFPLWQQRERFVEELTRVLDRYAMLGKDRISDA
jgi:pimeloyl-ACP methyl ester carboxylesterase